MKISQRWWDELTFLAPDVRSDYGRLLNQLERGFTPIPARPDEGDPAGWAGLTRRGRWERLLTSDWALAEAAPEEFIRRAGEGELSYWQLAREARRQSREVLVWVDSGPDQLGACRLVQLALLFYLQHLCQVSGGRFYWGVIQAPQKLYDQLGRDEVQTYLRSRSLEAAQQPVEAVSAVQSWCIGCADWLSRVPASFARVALRQASAESVELEFRGRKLNLQLPPGERASRLLKDPFSWVKPGGPSESRVNSSGGVLRFSQCGRKLLVVEPERVLVIPLPSSPREPAGRTRVFHLRRQGTVMAVAWERNALYVAQESEGKWQVYRQNPAVAHYDGRVAVEAPDKFRGALGSCWPLLGDDWLLWVGEQLWKVTPGGAERLFATRGGFCLGSRAALARLDEDRLVNPEGQKLYDLPQQHFRRVMLCNGYGFGVTQQDQAVAVDLDGQKWRLLWQRGSATVSVPGKVVGLVPHLRRQQPGLLIQNAHNYVIQGADWSEVVEIGFLIAETVVHPEGLIAYRTEGGQLRCYSVPAQSALWASSS